MASLPEWQGMPSALVAEWATLGIWAEDADGRTAEDTVRVLVGNTTGTSRERLERDQDNALPAWPEHGLLGTQLGPNKNGESGRWSRPRLRIFFFCH